MPAPVVSLARSSDIDRIYRRGTLLRGAFFQIRASRGRGPANRVVVITPKKIFRRAVDRNRMARRTRAIARPLLPREPYDLIFLPRAEALRTKTDALRKDLDQLLAQLA